MTASSHADSCLHIRRSRSAGVAALSHAILLLTISAVVQSAQWETQQVDPLSNGRLNGPRNMVLDSSGYPHVAYGGDSLYYQWEDGDGWHKLAIDADVAATDVALAFDAADYPHVCYHDPDLMDLKHAWKDDLGWHVEMVDSADDVGAFASIAVDASERLHIAYRDDTHNALKYAVKSDAGWQFETVDSGTSSLKLRTTAGTYAVLAIDAVGTPHILYRHTSNWMGDVYSTTVKHATKGSMGWVIGSVDSCSGTERTYTTLCADSAGNLHAAYVLDVGLIYASQGQGSWHTVTVDANGGNCKFPSIAGSATGNICISYFNDAEDDLILASNAGSGWHVQTLRSSGAVGKFSSLALDANGSKHICYDNTTTGTAVYLHQNGGTWDEHILETAARNVGTHTSLALDSASRPHIAYYDETGHDLRYAYQSGSEWVSATVDSVGDVGQYASIALDSFGQPHIAYYDATNGDLRYAWLGSRWYTQLVDAGNGGIVGQYCSLGLDSHDRAHISYFDRSNSDLRYASNAQGSWQSGSVDNSSDWDLGYYSSLAIDASGFPHIAYCRGNWHLKYAWMDGSGWHNVTVDWGNCYWSSLALDANGQAHISYQYPWDGMLRYVSGRNDNWGSGSVVVDQGQNLGLHTCIAVDASGTPYISYFDGGNGRLKLASRPGGQWTTQVVDDAGTAGEFSSLVLDPSNRPHLSYRHVSRESLYYAHTPPLRLTGVALFDEDAIQFQWEGASGTTEVAWCGDLASGTWSVVPTEVSSRSCTVDCSSAVGFFRIADVWEPSNGTEPVILFTEELNAFDAYQDLGDNSTYGVQVLPEASSPMSDGNALRMFDLSSVDKPELQGELDRPLFEPFRIDFQSYNQSVNSSSSAIRFRMGNAGQSMTTQSRTAFSLSFEASGQISAKYDDAGAIATIKTAPLEGVQAVTLIANGSLSEPYSYSFAGVSRTLNPTCYDVFINGVLFNSAAELSSGMPFQVVASYLPSLGIKRFGLIGSSNANVDPDYLFDNIILSLGDIAEP